MNTETEETVETNESEAVHLEYWKFFRLSVVTVGVGVPALALLSYLLGDDGPSEWSGWEWASWFLGVAVVMATGLVFERRARRKRVAQADASAPVK